VICYIKVFILSESYGLSPIFVLGILSPSNLVFVLGMMNEISDNGDSNNCSVT